MSDLVWDTESVVVMPANTPTWELSDLFYSEDQWLNSGAKLSDVWQLSDFGPASAPKGLMIAFELSADVAQQIGCTEHLPHITLAYVPGTVLDHTAVDKIQQITLAASRTVDPLLGAIGGAGRFEASPTSDGRAVEIALADVPGLSEFRTYLVAKLNKAGIQHSTAHGFIPHVTLRYVDPAAGAVKPILETPLVLSAIIVAQGDTQLARYELRNTVKAGQKSKAEAPKGFSLAEATTAVNRSSAELLKVLTGKEQTVLIMEFAKQAVAQRKRGVAVSQLVFTPPPHLEHKLLPAIAKLHSAAKQQAVTEIRGLSTLKAKVPQVQASELFYSEDEARDEHGRWSAGSTSRFAYTEDWEKSLPSDQLKAVEAWQYRPYAQTEMQKADATGEHNERLAAFNKALETAPLHTGMAYRGIQVKTDLQPGAKITLDHLTSFSTNRAVASSFAVGKGSGQTVSSKTAKFTLFQVESHAGFPELPRHNVGETVETEVIGHKGRMFEVSSVEKYSIKRPGREWSGSLVHLKEI